MKHTWYHLTQGHCFGPFTFEHLRDRAQDGMLKPTDEVMCETNTGGNYVEAGAVPGLFGPLPQASDVAVAVMPTPSEIPPTSNRGLWLGLLIGSMVLMGAGLILLVVLRMQQRG